MCGRYILVQHEIAQKYLASNGTIRLHPLILCSKCIEWVTINIETQMRLPLPKE